jgi:polysaccharide biosynthesis transport protein
MPGSELVPVTVATLAPTPVRTPVRSGGDIEQLDAFGQLRATWDILLKHQWLILATAFVVTLVVAVYSFKMKPIYRATARVDVQAEEPLLQSLNDLFRTEQADDSFLAAQMSILQSDNLSWQTIKSLGLSDVSGDMRKSDSGVDDVSARARNAAIAAFRADLKVERPKDTRMLLVSYESADPRLASSVVNTLVNNFVENNFQTKYDSTRQATGWMEERLDELKLKVEKSEEAMVTYERQNNIANIGDKQTASEAQLEEMTKSLSQAQTDRLSKESLYKMVAGNESGVGFVAQNNSLLGSLEAKQIDLKEQYSEALARYGPTYPRALAIQEQMKDLQALIGKERKRVVENLRQDYLASAEREKFLAQAVDSQKLEVNRVNQLLIEHNLLKRDFETNQSLYEDLLKHLKDANVSAGLRATNIRIIDHASIPSTPVRPNRTRNIEFALAAGLILGIAFAFTREALDNSIKSAQEIERLTSLPTLSMIPRHALPVLHRSNSSQLKSRRNGHRGELSFPVELAVMKKPGAAISESYRALRTSILLSTAERPPQVLLITSAQPSEGKTSTTLNLAVTLAQKGSRVLVVDSDLRRPAIAKALSLSGDHGLSEILTGVHEFDEAQLQRVDGVDTLYLLAAGPHPPNPAELLCSLKMEMLLKQLRQRFDHILLDSPPVLPITDATILSNLVDGVVLVVECEGTTRVALSRACNVIEHSGGKILGTVLNKVDIRRDGYYGYKYYHGYYSYRNNAYYREDESAASD